MTQERHITLEEMYAVAPRGICHTVPLLRYRGYTTISELALISYRYEGIREHILLRLLRNRDSLYEFALSTAARAAEYSGSNDLIDYAHDVLTDDDGGYASSVIVAQSAQDYADERNARQPEVDYGHNMWVSGSIERCRQLRHLTQLHEREHTT